MSNAALIDCVLGIDVAKDHLDIFIDSTTEEFQVKNTVREIAALVEKLTVLKPDYIIVEATGGFETALVTALATNGLAVSVVSPHRVRSFARAVGVLAKNDRLDAQLLARFGRDCRPMMFRLSELETMELEALLQRRRQLIEMHVAEENRLLTAPVLVKKQIKEHLRWLEKRIADSDRDLQNRLKQTALWCEQDKIVQFVPGVGRVLSLTLLASLPELRRLNRKQIAALCGVAPFARIRWRPIVPARAPVGMPLPRMIAVLNENQFISYEYQYNIRNRCPNNKNYKTHKNHRTHVSKRVLFGTLFSLF